MTEDDVINGPVVSVGREEKVDKKYEQRTVKVLVGLDLAVLRDGPQPKSDALAAAVASKLETGNLMPLVFVNSVVAAEHSQEKMRTRRVMRLTVLGISSMRSLTGWWLPSTDATRTTSGSASRAWRLRSSATGSRTERRNVRASSGSVY